MTITRHLCVLLPLLLAVPLVAQVPLATSQPVGQGCAITAFQPELSITPPVLGQPITFTVATSFTSLGGTLFVSPGPAVSSPVPGAPANCQTHLDLLTVQPFLGFASGGASWSLTLTVPPDPALIGQTFTFQALITAGPPFSATPTLTNGVTVTAGL